MNSFEQTKENLQGKTIEELLEYIDVQEIAMLDIEGLDESFNDWHAVSSDLGVIGLFENETCALRFRLDYINRILNP